MTSSLHQRSNSSDSRRRRGTNSRSRSTKSVKTRGSKPSFLSGASSTSSKRPRVDARSSRSRRSFERANIASVKDTKRLVKIVGITIAIISALLLGVYALSFTNAFPVKNIQAHSTDHISADQIVKLCDIKSGVTLLNYDEDQIVSRLKRNPWVKSASVTRSFPNDLVVNITQRKVGYIVLIGPEHVAWYVSDDAYWIEPLVLESKDEEIPKEQLALMKAKEIGCYLVEDVPVSIEPRSANKVSGDILTCISIYTSEFSDEFKSQIASFSAPSKDSISATLKSGVKVSLGNSVSVAEKEKVIKTILDAHPNQVTYINVRVPSSPTYRKVQLDNVEAGSGAYDATNSKD